MWKCRRDSIYFNTIYFIFVDILYYPKLGPLLRIQNTLSSESRLAVRLR